MEVDSKVPAVTTPSSKTPRHDLMMMDEAKSRNTFFKQTKSYPMFPCFEEKIKWDDYGESIRYLIHYKTVIVGGGACMEKIIMNKSH